MDSCNVCSGAISLAVRNMNIGVLAKLLSAQKQDGIAANRLIETAGAVAQQGAPEPGKGAQVDVVA